MADENANSYLLGSFGVADYPSLKFRNSQWRMEHGEPKCKKLLDCDEIWCSEDFGVADNESEIDI